VCDIGQTKSTTPGFLQVLRWLLVPTLFFPLAIWLPALAGEVVIVDGDTLILDGTTYRLHGIDAPEAGQKCAKANGGNWARGNEATAMLESLTAEKDVACEPLEQDDYGRVIAVCHAGPGDSLNAQLVASGHAWAFRKFSDDFASIEDQARKAALGVWQAPTQPPWEFRAERWAVAEQKAPAGCPIKGNIGRGGERIYHAPWSPWYSRTKINEAKGERWFCDEAEALAAGWRAPRWGR